MDLRFWQGFFIIALFLLKNINSWLVFLPENPMNSFFICVELLRNNLIIEFITPIKKTLRSFLRSLPNYLKTYLSLISLMVFYSILGLHLLKGLDENRCRFTELPENNLWDVDESVTNLCGVWACPIGLFY